MENDDLQQENGIDLLSRPGDDAVEIEPPDIEPDPVIPIYPDDNDTDNNYSYYESIWEGQQIDEAIRVILGGEIEGARDSAVQAAQDAEDSAQSASESAQAAQDASVKTPYIGNDGNWMVYNAETKSYQNSNIKATGSQGPAGVDGKTPTLSIDSNGHLIATYN